MQSNLNEEQRVEIAFNPSTKLTVLEKLSQDVDTSVRIAVASNTSSSPQILELLSCNPYTSVRAAVGGNFAIEELCRRDCDWDLVFENDDSAPSEENE